MISAIDHCRKIRNKYAHAFWHDPDQGKHLCYVSLEELADDPHYVASLNSLTLFYLDEALLLAQEQYFEYARGLMHYINHEGQFRARLINQNPFQRGDFIKKPPFFTRKA